MTPLCVTNLEQFETGVTVLGRVERLGLGLDLSHSRSGGVRRKMQENPTLSRAFVLELPLELPLPR